MKNILVLILINLVFCVNAQTKLITKTGIIIFDASVPVFEPVYAKNEQVTCVLNTKNGDIQSLALIKAFRFKIALMEEHFNENYAESDKYKKAVFRGRLENFSIKDLSTTEKQYTLKGKLEFHGKTKDIITIATVRKTELGIVVKSNFILLASDYEIPIPKLVKNKLTNNVNVTLDFLLK